jgi:hypothetical protein
MPRRKNRGWQQRSTNAPFRGQLCIPGRERRERHAKHDATASMIKPALILSVVSFALSATARAQVVPKTPTPIPIVSTAAARSSATAGCHGGNGIHISSTSGTLTDSSSGVNTVIGLNQSVDTTLVFDISRKTWTRTNVAAAISIGLADESRGRYAICAGVTALMPSATLTISGARGRVHFIASLKELSDALRLGPVQ